MASTHVVRNPSNTGKGTREIAIHAPTNVSPALSMRVTTHGATMTLLVTIMFFGTGSPAEGQGQAATNRLDALQELNRSVESLVARVSRSVVQVLVTTYGPVNERSGVDLVLGRQRGMGSGVVIDADGYIVTNAHLLSNARRVEVVVPGRMTDEAARPVIRTPGRRVDARIVGVASEIDLALLKIDGIELPPLKMANYETLRQGVLVFAFGSPDGFPDSVTMGIVSAVARQPDPDSPLVYVQTDAPINRGNSGGPLVNVKGELVGINTFIVSDSGGSQGVGFAIPSALVEIAYPKLRRYGHLHRGEVGIQLQAVTPTLASGLGLTRNRGVLVSDVLPGSPAERAGIKVQDIILSIDGESVGDVPRLAFRLFTSSAGDRLTFGILRGSEPLTVAITATERAHNFDPLTAIFDPDANVIPRLGILGIDVRERNAQMAPTLRVPSGVMVIGHTRESANGADTGLTTGDTIHRINEVSVVSVDQIRTVLATLKPRSPVVLQIERNGQMMFLTFELD